ncbi:MAG: hypothetical protein K9J85_10785 [Desulfobacteraceae bacterium]|nr:hypothetical protein [Desulfobacteraceae bacterium]
MEIAGPVIAILIVAAVIGLLVSAAFLFLGASIVGVENRTFGKALATTIIGGIASFVASLFLSILPVIGTILGFICGFFISALIMMSIFSTTFGNALGATVLAWVFSLIVFGGITLLILAMFGGLAAML